MVRQPPQIENHEPPVIIHGYNNLGMPICNSPRRNKPGRRCQSTHLFKNGRCVLHGGNDNPGEVALPKDRRGEIASHLPPRLRKVFTDSVDNPNQLSMSLEIGLMDANLTRIQEKLDGLPTSDGWRRLKMLLIKLQKAYDEGSNRKLKTVLEELKEVIAVGSTESDVWEEMQSSMVSRAKLMEAEVKRLVASKTVVTVQEAELIVATLFRVMQTHIPLEMLKKVKEEFVKKMELPDYIQAIGPGEEDIPEAPEREVAPDHTRNYRMPGDDDDDIEQ